MEAEENQQMTNAAFVGQAQGDIRQKLQKLEGFAGMNGTQFLEVATKVFVNQDQEAKWEADRKMKKKVDLLAAALVEQSDGSQQASPGRDRATNLDLAAARFSKTPHLWNCLGIHLKAFSDD
jgi:hypothetical protein